MPKSICLFVVCVAFSCTFARAGSDWPQFRGPGGQGISDAVDLPVNFAEGEPTVKWKVEIKGKAWSSPVIAGDQVWMTNATEDGKELSIVVVDKNSGQVIRNQKLYDIAAPQYCIPFNSYASPTPAVDMANGRIFVTFGAPATACLDLKTAKVLWERRDFVCNHFRAPGSSILLYKNMLILPFDGSDYQYLVAMDQASGKTIWKTDRTVDFADIEPKTGKPKADGDFRKAFSTPRIATVDGKPLLISAGSKAHYAYDPDTGKEIWRIEHKQAHTVALTPVIGDNLVYIGTGHGSTELWAVDPRGSGVLGADHLKWKIKANAPTRNSPLLHEGLLYVVSDGGIAMCLDAKTGQEYWKERIKSQFSASPIYADGKIWFFSEAGYVTLLAPGKEFKKIAENKFPPGFMATPAISGKAMYLRSKTHLYKIEK